MQKIKLLAKSDGTSLEQHTNDVIHCYEQLKNAIEQINKVFLKKLCEHDQIIRAVLFYHDQGKRYHAFQNVLYNKKVYKNAADDRKLKHEMLSNVFITQDLLNQWCGGDGNKEETIQMAIALHHNREKPNNIEELNKIWKQAAKALKEDFEFYKQAIQNEKIENKIVNKSEQVFSDWSMLLEKGWSGEFQKSSWLKDFYEQYEDKVKDPLFILLKGLLHKCDYAASGGVENIEELYQGNFDEDLQRGIKEWGVKASLSPLQKHAASFSLQNKSVIMIAPTGSGKTEFAMNWINKEHKCKVFYLLGMRTAVKKMYERWGKWFGSGSMNLLNDAMNSGNKAKNVGLLHGELSYHLIAEAQQNNNQDENIREQEQLIRYLGKPITIATADQLVTAALKYPGFELSYVTASYSQIIVDEIQSFSPYAMAIIVKFLIDLHKLGAKFLLMTATLPPFVKEELSSAVGDDLVFLNPVGDSNCPQILNTNIKRHCYSWLEKCFIDSDEAIENIKTAYQKGKKVLVLCNTVIYAQKLTELLKEEDAQLLHARFTRKDRAAKETAIMAAAANDSNIQPKENKHKACIWVSTQIVEASLDIDFDEIHTEICTIDSLLQRFGRCYRGREYKLEEPNIFIYDYNENAEDKNYTAKIYDIDYIKATIATLNGEQYNKKLLSEKDKLDIFNAVFEKLSEHSSYRKKYDKMSTLLKNDFKVESRNEAQKLLRENGLLTNNLIPPVHHDDVDELIDKWETAIAEHAKDKNNIALYTKKLRLESEIMGYTVSATVKAGAKIPVCSKAHAKKFIQNLYYLFKFNYKYDERLGLIQLKDQNETALIE